MSPLRRIWIGAILLAGMAFHGSAQLTCDTCTFAFSPTSIAPIDWNCADGDGSAALPPFPSFSTTCAPGNYFAKSFRYPSLPTSTCLGEDPNSGGSTEAGMVLQSFTATGLVTSNQFFFTSEGLTFTTYSENRARLTGQMANGNNPNAILELDLYFDESFTGAEYMSTGGELDISSAEGTTGEDWSVWILKPYMSKFIGAGDLSGYHFVLDSTTLGSGTPLQVGGPGANAINLNDGLSGDFDWYACVGGTVYSGNCALAADFTSCTEGGSDCAADIDFQGEYFIGNLNSFDQIAAFVNVIDNEDPVWDELPEDHVIGCDVDLALLDADETISATDGCSSLTIDTVETIVVGDCPHEYTRIRTFTATDACGSSIEHVQTVTVTDEIAPTLNVPEGYTIGCQEEPIYDLAWAEDNCTNSVTVSETESIIPGICSGEYTIQRTFSATDECGNVSTASQIIAVEDLTPPTLVLPNDTVLPCGSMFITPAVSAFDDCTAEDDISIISFSSFPVTSCPAQKILKRRFIATDECGNSTQGIHYVIIDDQEAPEFTSLPLDMTVACDAEIILEEPSAVDACASDFEIVTEIDTTFLECSGNYDVIRTFTATDECGNANSSSQTISVRDTVAPLLVGTFDDITLDCDATFEPAIPDFVDNCSSVDFSSTMVTIGDASASEYQIQHILTVSDGCGNESEYVQTVSFVDTTAPEFTSVPAD